MAAAQDNDQDVVTGINVTPLVDVMLVLLIVFMVTAHFIQDGGLKVNLPKAQTTQPLPTPALNVVLNAKGDMKLMDRDVDKDALRANLARETANDPGVRVVIYADEDLPYKSVTSVLDLIKGAGVTRVALAAAQ